MQNHLLMGTAQSWKGSSVFAETEKINIQSTLCKMLCNNRCPYISDLWPFKVNYNTQVADILQGK